MQNLIEQKLKKYFDNKIKFSFTTLLNTLIVTKDDKVYEFDKYCEDYKDSLVGVSVQESDIERFIEKAIKQDLCGKNIIKFQKVLIEIMRSQIMEMSIVGSRIRL